MPVPTPESSETRSHFMERCVEFLTNEGKPNDQAVAICYTQWENREGKMEEQILFETTDMQMKAAEDTPTAEFIASKEVVDRDGEILKVNGIDIKNYKRNPVVLYAHRRDDYPIGKATKIIKTRDGELKIKVLFATEENEDAMKVYRLIKGGFLNAVSIGFRPTEPPEYPKDGKIFRVFPKTELLELSIVPVPANQDALALGKAAIEKGIISEEEVNRFFAVNEVLPDEEDELKEQVDELSRQVSYLAKLFEEYKEQDTSADAQEETDVEYTGEEMREIMEYFGIDPENYDEGE